MMNQSLSTTKCNVSSLQKFIWLLEEAQFYNAACTFLSDAFVFTSDGCIAKSKQEFLTHCLDKQFEVPAFGLVMKGEHANQFIRMARLRGSGFPPCVVKQAIAFDTHGKIESISIEKHESVSFVKAFKSRLRSGFVSTSRKTASITTLSLPVMSTPVRMVPRSR